METRANYVVVGIFTLVAILAAFAFVYWMAAFGNRGEVALLRVRIPGSASGLATGSGVFFNGVKVGDVRRVYIDTANPSVAIADTQVDRLTPITRSTKAVIGIAGLTGQATLEIKGTDSQEPNLFDEADENGTVAEITADPSAVTNLLEKAQDIFKRADNVLGDLESFTGEAKGPLIQTVQNVEKFSGALARNSDGVDKFLDSVSKLSGELAGVSGKLDGTLKAAEDILKAVDPKKVQTVVENVDKFTADLAKTSAQFDDTVREVRETVATINNFAKGAQVTLGKVDGVLDGVDPAKVRSALANIEQASRSANAAAADIAKVTEKFSNKSEQIDQMISDASEMMRRLNQASVRVDGVLAKVDSLLGSDNASNLITNANDTLKGFKQVADTLNSKLGVITDGLARFSGQGLRDAEALIQDGRRSINRIERAITDLERNPQRIITGGDGTVRQYDGRARR
ncbi:MlaD family protein [Mesorhizobium sp. CN2-181]|uniref:MlaD family protein n=1 Tax=Mesorhizobium yinganensis TaxID=3157707 RepID=UPI0032B761F8